MEPVRISKLMAQKGLCSRREADVYIQRGWVRVNGQVVSELGSKALPNAKIVLERQASSAQTRKVSIILNKPVGYVVHREGQGYKLAVSLIRPDSQYRRTTADSFNPGHLRGLAPAGRLDIDSQGLLVLTQDGRIARQLIGADSELEKEYLVRVQGNIQPGGLALLNNGLSLDGHALKPAKVDWLNDDQLHFVLREGRKRQIRRMCEQVGLKVVGLKRVRMGKIVLGDLPTGKWRYLKPNESF